MKICSTTELQTELVSINFAGDIMLGDSFHMLGIGVGSVIYHRGTEFIFQKIMPVLKKADLNIGNLECVFSDGQLKPWNNLRPYITHSSDYVTYLCDAGLWLLNMANNHTMQYGEEVFSFTENTLLSKNIKTIGTIRNASHSLTIRGISFSFLGYSMRPDQFGNKKLQYIAGDRQRILDDVSVLSKTHDHVIVSIHWGDEYINRPSHRQIELAHAMIDAGASMVIGHHPHVLQGIEYYGNGAIAYSLGNFIFDKPQKIQRKSIVLQALFSKNGLKKTDAIPIYINRHYQPEVATGKTKEEIVELMLKLNKKLSESDGSDKYSEEVSNSLKKMRLQFYLYFLLNFYRYHPKILMNLLKGAVRRKIGGRRI